MEILTQRYEDVIVWYGGDCFGPERILDKRDQKLRPYQKEEWFWDNKGNVAPSINGGIWQERGIFNNSILGQYPPANAVSSTIIDLNNNFTIGSAGTGVAYVYFCNEPNMILQDSYWHFTLSGSSKSTIDDINVYVRDGSANLPTTSAGALLYSGAINPASTDGTHKLASMNTALTMGNWYWIIVADADGNASNYATYRIETGWPDTNTFNANYPNLYTRSTTNGWASDNNNRGRGTPRLVFTNGRVMGYEPTSTDASHGSGTNKRGMFINDVPADMFLYGAIWYGSGSGVFSGISGSQLFDGSTLPGGSPILSGTSLWYDSNTVCALFSGGHTFYTGMTYRFVLTSTGNDTMPWKHNIGIAGDTNLRKMLPGAGNICWTVQTGTTWNNLQDSIPGMGLLVKNYGTLRTFSSPGRHFPILPTT